MGWGSSTCLKLIYHLGFWPPASKWDPWHWAAASTTPASPFTAGSASEATSYAPSRFLQKWQAAQTSATQVPSWVCTLLASSWPQRLKCWCCFWGIGRAWIRSASWPKSLQPCSSRLNGTYSSSRSACSVRSGFVLFASGVSPVCWSFSNRLLLRTDSSKVAHIEPHDLFAPVYYRQLFARTLGRCLFHFLFLLNAFEDLLSVYCPVIGGFLSDVT